MKTYEDCPRCGKSKGDLTPEKYNQGVRKARCPRCKTEFWVWAGKGWLPEHEHVLQDALVAQMESRSCRAGWGFNHAHTGHEHHHADFQKKR